MLRALLFGFNGVLVDDGPVHREVFQRVLAEEGLALSADDPRRYLGLGDRNARDAGGDRGGFAAALAAGGEPASPPRLMRLNARKASYYQEWIRAHGYPFFAGAGQLVAAAAAAGWMLGVVSGALREEVDGALRQAGLRERFKLLVTAEDVASGEPDPEGYRQALEALNTLPPLPERLIHPHEVVAIEDSPAALRAASEAGLRTLAIAHTHAAASLSAADAVVGSLSEIGRDRLERLFAR